MKRLEHIAILGEHVLVAANIGQHDLPPITIKVWLYLIGRCDRNLVVPIKKSLINIRKKTWLQLRGLRIKLSSFASPPWEANTDVYGAIVLDCIRQPQNADQH